MLKISFRHPFFLIIFLGRLLINYDHSRTDFHYVLTSGLKVSNIKVFFFSQTKDVDYNCLLQILIFQYKF